MDLTILVAGVVVVRHLFFFFLLFWPENFLDRLSRTFFLLLAILARRGMLLGTNFLEVALRTLDEFNCSMSSGSHRNGILALLLACNSGASNRVLPDLHQLGMAESVGCGETEHVQLFFVDTHEMRSL
jgi:hypothetical protein